MVLCYKYHSDLALLEGTTYKGVSSLFVLQAHQPTYHKTSIVWLKYKSNLCNGSIQIHQYTPNHQVYITKTGYCLILINH